MQLSFVGQLGVSILADHTSDQFALGLFGAVLAWNYQALVAFRLLTGRVTVHDLRLRGASGVRHQIDALVGDGHKRVLIETKDYDTVVGLPIIRTSVEHGTDFANAGKGTGDPRSLIQALKLAATMAENRAGKCRGVA